MKAVALRTEYLKNPMGIDMKRPRFFWNCEGGFMQSAYRIMAVNDQGKTVWDTQKKTGGRMSQIPYEGTPLKSRERISWKVKLWDENDKEGDWSEEAGFEMGLLSQQDWKASWITGDYRPAKKERYPADLFRKIFSLPEEKNIVKARLYATACGVYQCRVNGKALEEFILAPGITVNRVRIQYQCYDVTSFLQAVRTRWNSGWRTDGTEAAWEPGD